MIFKESYLTNITEFQMTGTHKWVKLRTSNFVATFTGSIKIKPR